MKEISYVQLLQIFLCQVLQITLRKRNITFDNDVRSVSADINLVTEVVARPLDLDPIIQKLLEVWQAEYLVFYWKRAINTKLLLYVSLRGSLLHH
jgi:hypothetical protein